MLFLFSFHRAIARLTEAVFSKKFFDDPHTHLLDFVILHVNDFKNPPKTDVLLVSLLPFLRGSAVFLSRNIFNSLCVHLISGAVISQLISRVIWSWPSWDAASHDEDSLHNILQVGTAKVKMSDEEGEVSKEYSVLLTCLTPLE